MLNLNIGILGHVDSGKTSLAKVISEIESTAAFDKNPQSKARGITLDLGFSSFCIPTPSHLQDALQGTELIQLTLVDCPGHASLIRTIIGGAQIIDLILLVIDATKGIQTQTAECLVIGEITCQNMIVVLNKIDLLDESKKEHLLEKMKKRLGQILSTTCFAAAPIVSISANPKNEKPLGIDNLINQISKSAFIPIRNKSAPFLYAIDHCFSIKGRGTILTGTVLQGAISIDDVIDLPAINLTKKIKSLQIFKKSIQTAYAGDRVGICVTQFDPKLIERGITCAPGLANFIYSGIICANKIKYFKGLVTSKAKFHISIGYETTLACVTCFKVVKDCVKAGSFDFDTKYKYSECLSENLIEENIQEYLLLEFEKPVLAVDNCTVIGSKLDMDIHGNTCRIAFCGTLLSSSKDKDYKDHYLSKLKIYKDKQKQGTIQRLVNENTVIVDNMFKKMSNLEYFIGLNVVFATGETGVIESSFGQNKKVKVYCKDGLNPSTIDILNKTKNKEINAELIVVTLNFRKYIFDNSKKIVQ